MKYSWALPQQPDLAATAIHFGDPDVLVEYDGPQLVLYRKNGVPSYLALASDYDDEAERWIVADVTKMEIETMAFDGLPMRDAFSRKPSLLISDFDHYGKPMRAWRSSVNDIPPGLLPVRGAPLPDFAREILMSDLALERPDVRRFRFDGSIVVNSTIGISPFSQVAAALQKLWSAIGESLDLRQVTMPTGSLTTELKMTPAFKGGSFAVTLEPTDDAVFEKVLSAYRQLSQDMHDDRISAASIAPDVRKALTNYVGIVQALGLETMIETPTGYAYLGHAGAPLLLANLKLGAKPEQKEKSDAPRRIVARGYFSDFNAEDSKFSFHDLDDGITKHGKIAAKLMKGWRAVDFKAVLSPGTHYKVTASCDKTGKKWRLIEMSQLGQMGLFDDTDAPAKRTKRHTKKT